MCSTLDARCCSQVINPCCCSESSVDEPGSRMMMIVRDRQLPRLADRTGRPPRARFWGKQRSGVPICLTGKHLRAHLKSAHKTLCAVVSSYGILARTTSCQAGDHAVQQLDRLTKKDRDHLQKLPAHPCTQRYVALKTVTTVTNTDRPSNMQTAQQPV